MNKTMPVFNMGQDSSALDIRVRQPFCSLALAQVCVLLPTESYIMRPNTNKYAIVLVLDGN